MLILLHLPYFLKPAFFSFLSFLPNLFSEILFPLIPKNSGVSGAKQNATYGKTASVFTLGFTGKKIQACCRKACQSSHSDWVLCWKFCSRPWFNLKCLEGFLEDYWCRYTVAQSVEHSSMDPVWYNSTDVGFNHAAALGGRQKVF